MTLDGVQSVADGLARTFGCLVLLSLANVVLAIAVLAWLVLAR